MTRLRHVTKPQWLRRGRLLHVIVACGVLVVVGTTALRAQVTFDRILRGDTDKQDWLTYSGSPTGQRHSPLTQITPDNVKNLELQWVFQVRSLEKFEATPLVVDGVMYTVQAPNDVIALDAATGRVFWVYPYIPSPLSRLCCGRVNRGLAILENTLYMATIDGHLLAIDAKTGGLVWNVTVSGARAEAGYSFTTAPLIVKDKVIIGTAGGEYGIRGFLAAFDAKTGREAWRFHTIAGPGEKGTETWAGESWKIGGGSIWVTGTYDRDLNLTYWGIGNPGPDWNGDVRAGDNLYSDSVVALDVDTGQLKWHFQFTPHDVYDYDSVQVPVLADISWQDSMRKVMLFANRNGLFYVLDRTTGQFLLGKPFTKVTWNSGLDDKGRPQNMVPLTEDGVLVYPGVQGATNWYSPSFSPRTGLFYVPTWVNTYSTFTKRPVEYKEGQRYTGALPAMPIRLLTPGPAINRRRPEEGSGAIQAIDPKTGVKKWEYAMSDVVDAGVLTTASDVVFSGGREGYVFALDARTGTMLWKANVGGPASNGPMTYAVGGRQYVAFAAGNAMFVYALKQ
ncbi:MAG TPA: PQQ-dependent dehydrogenase, methanol/ethanol family [Vicinamibacterales bacterium]|nr:PQQ-dependent dehydrogenase, methanol/ethanol family [Vicinamibacterales bacterium]